MEKNKNFLNFTVRPFLDQWYSIMYPGLLFWFPFQTEILITVRSTAKYSIASGPAKKDPTFGRPPSAQNSAGFKVDEQGEKILINGGWALFPGTGSVCGISTVRVWAIPLTVITSIIDRLDRLLYATKDVLTSCGRNILFRSHPLFSLKTYINTCIRKKSMH